MAHHTQALPETSGFLTGETIKGGPAGPSAPSPAIRYWDMAGEGGEELACSPPVRWPVRQLAGTRLLAARQLSRLLLWPPSRPPNAARPRRPPSLPAAAAPSFQAAAPTQTFTGHAQIPTALRGVAGDANTFASGAAAARCCCRRELHAA